MIFLEYLWSDSGKLIEKKKIINYSQMSISCGHVVRDFESEAKTRYNF